MVSLMRPFRILQKHWKLTVIAVFSLSIAMALGVLSLSLINNFLFVPPAGQDPDRLVIVKRQRCFSMSAAVRRRVYAFVSLTMCKHRATSNALLRSLTFCTRSRCAITCWPVALARRLRVSL
jgi:hypothetical protein